MTSGAVIAESHVEHQRRDGIGARHGTLTAPWERFMPWRTVEGTSVAVKGTLELATLVNGIFEKRRFLAIVRCFNVLEGVCARSRVMVKRLLRKFGYPPDKQEHATQLVLAQAEVVCEEWAA